MTHSSGLDILETQILIFFKSEEIQTDTQLNR